MSYHDLDVVVHPHARLELARLPPREKEAVDNAIGKLRAAGTRLGAPYTSQAKGSTLRELRRRAGRSAWRALYARVGSAIVILAIGPEAQSNPRGFQRAIRSAATRLADLRP
jgi:hypothetical protein